MSWLALKSKLVGLGAAILVVLAFFVRLQTVKNQRDKAKVKADTLEASAHAERVKKKITREEEREGVSRRETIRKKVKELEKGDVKDEDFEGVDNLTDPNDY